MTQKHPDLGFGGGLNTHPGGFVINLVGLPNILSWLKGS